MVYKIVAERENQKLQSERASVLIAIAKARVWASVEGRVLGERGMAGRGERRQWNGFRARPIRRSRIASVSRSPTDLNHLSGKTSTNFSTRIRPEMVRNLLAV